MKANEILKAITGLDKANANVKNQCKTFADIFAMVKDLKGQIKSVEITPNPFYLGSYVKEERFKWNDYKIETIKGDEMPGEIWTIKTDKGTYKQTIPTGNDFYFAFRSLLSDFVPQVVTENRIADFEMDFTKEQTAMIKAAAKFCSKDELRPAMMNVKIEIKKEGLINIIATDGHKLYFEQFFTYLQLPEMEFLLPAKELSKVKTTLEVQLFKGEHNFETGKINGSSFDLVTDQYPNYLNVWPKYNDYIEVLRNDLIDAVKVQLPFANKTTSQIRLYFNGHIQISAEDLDFSNESCAKVSYLQKTTEDFEIGFNGKFLLECLSASKETKVRLYSDGKANRAMLIGDSALLMPVMLNQYA